MLRSVLSRAVLLFAFHSVIFGVVHATNVIVPHQGRLLDADDKPVSGTLDITYRIYDALTGGAMLWTEVHASVSVQDGLFDAMMGTVTPLPADVFRSSTGVAEIPPRWLEVQVGAVVLSPRMRLASVPHASVASGISGDILTNKGLAEVRDFSSATEDAIVISSHDGDNHLTLRCLNGLPPGEPVIGALSMTTSPSSSSLDIGDLDGDGLYQVLATSDSVTKELTFVDNGPGGATLMKAKEKANRTKCSSNLRSQSPSSSSEIDESCDLTRSTAKAITTKGTGAIASVKMDAGDSAGVFCDHDLDGNGEAENFVHSECSEGGASLRVVSLNGLPPGVPVEDNIAINANGSSSTVALAKGVAQVGLGVVGAVGIPGGAVISSRCLSASGLDTASTEQGSDGTGAAMRAINTKGTGAVVRVAATASDDATVGVSNDLDGNGDAECAASTSASSTGASHHLYKKGLNAVNVRTALSDSVGDAGFIRRIQWDIDNDGNYDMVSSTDGDSTGTRSVWKAGMSGSTTGTIRMQATGGGGGGGSMHPASEIVLEADTDGDGVANSRGGRKCDDDVIDFMEVDTDNDGNSNLQMNRRMINADAKLTNRMSVDSDDDGDADVSADIEVSSDSASFRLNGLPPGIPVTATISMVASTSGVHMEVGSAYCDGTNWVNASDKNSKENFQKVDGEELLEKISELDITKWNYKSDKETEHIGPTAQDFKDAFGVGSDGKSISTIDPSGIALAAIKELYTQLKDKDREIADLRKSKDKDMDELRSELAKLRQELKKK